MAIKKKKIFLVVSEDWSFWSHRLSLALSAMESGFEVTLVTKINMLASSIKNKGINVINLNFGRSSKTPLTDLINIVRLFFLFKKEKPDLIHNVALKTILISSMSALFNRKTVVVNAFTGLGYVFSSEQFKARVIRLFFKSSFNLITRKHNFWTIFQNSDDMNAFQKRGLSVPERSILIRGSGVDTNEFNQSKDLNDIPVIMLASRMLWDKGVGEFVEAAKLINSTKTKAKFILVGNVDPDNPMSIPIPTLKEWSNEGHIIWQGYSKTMPETLASASIVCLPSYREGLPKVLLEAAAVGRPLIATDVPGCREIVKNNENGLLVKLKDVDSLYNAMMKLIKNKKLRENMGEKSRKVVEAEFSAKIINKQTISFYNSILKIK